MEPSKALWFHLWRREGKGFVKVGRAVEVKVPDTLDDGRTIHVDGLTEFLKNHEKFSGEGLLGKSELPHIYIALPSKAGLVTGATRSTRRDGGGEGTSNRDDGHGTAAAPAEPDEWKVEPDDTVFDLCVDVGEKGKRGQTLQYGLCAKHPIIVVDETGVQGRPAVKEDQWKPDQALQKDFRSMSVNDFGYHIELRLIRVRTSGLRKDIVDEANVLLGRGGVTRNNDDIRVNLTFPDRNRVYEFVSRIETKLNIRQIDRSCIQYSEPSIRHYELDGPKPVYHHDENSPPESVRHSDSETSLVHTASSSSTFRKNVLDSGAYFEKDIPRNRFEAAHLAPQDPKFEIPSFLCTSRFKKENPLNGILLSPTLHRLFDNNPEYYFSWTRNGNELTLQVTLRRGCDTETEKFLRRSIDESRLILKHQSPVDAVCRAVFFALRRQWCEQKWGVEVAYTVQGDADLIRDTLEVFPDGIVSTELPHSLAVSDSLDD